MQEKITTLLEERIKELDNTAKLLVRRDFELLQANEKLREMDEAKSRFVSIAAHQLRTPLSGIKWAIQMLLAGDFGVLQASQRSLLQESYSTLERLIVLVGNLLSVARIEEGRVQYKFSLFQIEDVCKKVFQENLNVVEKKGITMTLTLPKTPLSAVYGDFENLVMALQNVLDNAIIYTDKKGKIQITVKKDVKDAKRVKISVQDTGIGIPDSQKDFIGQKFFRCDNVVRQQISGTGLGLYIVQKILEKHKGTLSFESKEGKGSTFSLILPFSQKSDIKKKR